MTVYLDSIFSCLATERLPWDALVWTETQQSVSEELERFKTFKNKLSRGLKFVFVIPVVSKKMAKDWGAVCQLLNNTLSALIRLCESRDRRSQSLGGGYPSQHRH